MSIEFTFKSSIMKNRQTTILYVLLCCTCLFSCQRDNTTKLLELAEAQIWENPDSTLQILEQIPSPEKDKEIERLNRLIGRLQNEIEELKKGSAQMENPAGCANAV